MRGSAGSCRLIVTADDFGRAAEVNQAVEEAHRRGVLTAASLMVTGAAAADAIARARRLPGLGVGLHVALVDAVPALPPERIPALVENDGRFSSNLVRMGARIFLSPAARTQLEAEMRTQFELYRATGLPLDHVDFHHHYHLHPTVFRFVLPLATEYGARGIRIPFEPPLVSWRARRERLLGRLSTAAFHYRRATRMRALAKRHGRIVNDAMFGLFESGALTAERLRAFLGTLPSGLNEIYCHPAVRPLAGDHSLPSTYLPVEEFQALFDPAVLRTVEERGIRLTTFVREGA